jgi:predicted DNA-binding transcriptional regulator YafY
MAETTARVLRLLGLLQSRPVWSGPELADRLGVTVRSVRRDVERLRDLGYPVRSAKGVGGGYQLGPGQGLPPLLLDPEEAVAVAVCLSLAAGGSVAGVDEAALRTLSKLDQVLPARLRAQVAAVQHATETLDTTATPADPATLMTLARGCRDHHRVRFGYVDHAGEQTARTVEPYRLVATGRRWYLLAHDVDRDDWRTFRLDRMRDVEPTTWTFRPREAPDAREHVSRAISRSPYPLEVRVHYDVPADVVRAQVPPTAATVEPLDDGRCLLVAGGERLDALAFHLSRIEPPGTVLEPPELRDAMRDLADRLGRMCHPV